MINALAFFAGLTLGLSHYEVYKVVKVSADAREARLYEQTLKALVKSEETMDQASALVVEMCTKQGGTNCVVEWY